MNMTAKRLEDVAKLLAQQQTLDQKMSPGVTTFLVWLGVTGSFWALAGWLIRRYYPALDEDDPSGHRDRVICIAMIVYFSLNILIILLYAFLIRRFQNLGWDEVHPDQTYSGTHPSLTWGIMGLFTMGGLFLSFIMLCHYSGYDLHPSLIVLLSLVALALAVTVALAGKIFVNCSVPPLKLTAEEQRCVTSFLTAKHAQHLQEQKDLIQKGKDAAQVVETRQGLTAEKLIEEASKTSGPQSISPGVSAASREEAAAAAAASRDATLATRVADAAAAASRAAASRAIGDALVGNYVQ